MAGLDHSCWNVTIYYGELITYRYDMVPSEKTHYLEAIVVSILFCSPVQHVHTMQLQLAITITGLYN